MLASPLTRAAPGLDASAFAGLFGRGVASERARSLARARSALAPESGPRATSHHGALALAAAAGADGQALASVDGCVCGLVGALYELDVLARELRLSPDAGAPEVLVAAFRRHGTDMLERLRGEFTLVLWDEHAGTGVLASDQVGASALFVRESSGTLLFASELRNLLPMLPARTGPDPVAMVHWLALGGPPAGHSFYEGIARVPGGHAVELRREGWRIVRYWRPSYGPPEPVDRHEAAARVRGALERAVARRSVPGERTGVMLSGGIDSASVAGVAVASGHSPAGAYSAVFPRHPEIDESALIGLLAGELGIASHALPVHGGELVSGSIGFMREWEAPSSSPNLFFWRAILEGAAEDGVTAMFDGEGGDALFWLSPHLLADRLTSGRLPSAVSLSRRFPADAGYVRPSVALRLLRDWGMKGAMPYRVHRLRQRLRGHAAFAPSWFTPQSARLRFDTDPALDWKRSGEPRWWSALLEEATGIGATLVHDATRRRNAAVGVRACHPLLDVDVIELVLSLPPEHAFDVRLSRPLLRESVRGLIPEPVRMRPSKSSFDALFHELLAGPELERARSLLLAPDAEVHAFVDAARVRTALFEAGPPTHHPAALQAWALDVWRLLTAELWLRHQAGRELAANY